MAKRKSTKMSLTLIISLFCIAVGAVAGYFTIDKVTENDKFILLGEKYIEVEIGQTFDEKTQGGYQVISFGKDISDKVVEDVNVDYTKPGQYYIRYTVDNFRFRGVERFRIINVVEAEDESI